MKKLYLATINQLYLAIRYPFFWLSMFLMMFFCFGSTIYYGIMYYDYSAIGIVTASDLYVLKDINVFWGVFSLLIPFICTFGFSMQPLHDKAHGTSTYLKQRVSDTMYYVSGALCSAITTFAIIFTNVMLSSVFLFIMFGENGNTNEGAKYSNAYFENIFNGYSYQFQELHMSNPILYNIIVTVCFSLFCSIIAVFMYSISIIIKKEKLFVLLVAGILSFMINQFFLITNYSIYGDVTASTIGAQSGAPTVILGVLMLCISVGIIDSKR